MASIKYGNVQNIGLVFEGDWTCGLCRLTVGDIKIQNCFVVGTNFSYSCSQGAVTKNGTVTNCLAVSGKLEGTKYSNDHRLLLRTVMRQKRVIIVLRVLLL